MSTIPASWAPLCASADLPAALIAHLSPAFATTSENRALLERVATKARHARVVDDPSYPMLEIDLGVDHLLCFAPSAPVAELPADLARIVALHQRIKLREHNLDLFAEEGIEDEGWLDGTSLEGRRVLGASRVDGDLYVYDLDEPRLYFLDHVMVDEDGPSPVEGDLAHVFLTRLARYVTA